MPTPKKCHVASREFLDSGSVAAKKPQLHDPAADGLDYRVYLRPQRPSVLGFYIKNYTIGS